MDQDLTVDTKGHEGQNKPQPPRLFEGALPEDQGGKCQVLTHSLKQYLFCSNSFSHDWMTFRAFLFWPESLPVHLGTNFFYSGIVFESV